MRPGNRRPAVVLALGAVLGALTWAAWLGWDRAASSDVVTGTVQTPYATLQVRGDRGRRNYGARGPRAPRGRGRRRGPGVLGCVDRRCGISGRQGLYVVGALVLAFGLALGTTVAAAAGVAVRTAMEAAHRRRAARGRVSRREAGGS